MDRRTVSRLRTIGSGRLAGVWPIATTPFADDGRLDLSGLTRVVEHILEGGAHGLVYPAIASEFQTLDAGERRAAVEHLMRATAGRRPVIVGISSMAADMSPAALAEHAARQKAAAVMLMPAPGEQSGVASVIALFKSVAGVCGLPIVLQNAPPPLGPALSMDAITEVVAAVPSIRYVKEETQPCGQRIMRLIHGAVDLDGVFGGAGGRFVLDELARGATGSMPACEFTAMHVRLYERFAAGDRTEARRLFNALLPLLNFESVFRTPATKFILHRMGVIDSPRHRDDNPDLDEADRRELLFILEQLGALTVAGADAAAGIAGNG
jgi:4-hydroxy-tetrahydrodipicolinate synthase